MNINQASPRLLEASGISKSFGAVSALKNASLSINKGEIIALMGANGAGKSTFVKILTGALKADSGLINIHGETTKIGSPNAARKSGLVPVYQEPSLIPDLTVAENLRLCNTPVSPFQHWVDELGIDTLRLDQMVGHLPLATLRILDLARALAIEPNVLLLDEMTAALPTDLVDRVLKVVRTQADAGQSIIYISHRFSEIAEICDRATVLRDGITVGDLPVSQGVEERVVELMLGEALEANPDRQTDTNETAIDRQQVPALRTKGLTFGTKLEDISIDLHRGEVLGVVALEGQGQDELFEVLAGLRRPSSGEIQVDGKPVALGHPADAIKHGLTFVPGDRSDGLLMERSVHENIAVPQLAKPKKWGAIKMRKEAESVKMAIERLQIDTRAQGEVRRLSGGNQQKVTIGRWIAGGVDKLLLFDPTRGIDVRTKRQIYLLVRELTAQGAAVLFYTSELSEVPAACDRVVVIFKGRVVDIIDAKDADEATLMRAAYGLTALEGETA